ncbi:MAG: flavodoxin [Deltaproteobacteria bacterium]
MNKKAIIYSFNTIKTAKAVKMITEQFDENEIELINAEDLTAEKFLSYNHFILGVPTWFDGELPNYWDEFVPEIEDMDLKTKKFAIFGNGNQKEYSENFVDGIGLMAHILESRGANIIGHTSTEGYTFEKSRALRNGKFLGLALDFENQSAKNKDRITNWIKQIKNEFNV